MTLIPAIFGLDGLFNMIAQLIVLAAVVIWLALVWYTYTDAKRRLEDRMLIRSAAAAALIFPLVGTVVYVIVRPPEYIEDRVERELEMQAAAA
ncbi:MAG: zinc ribbon domain-containing protein, partial [Actinobacteria bacterium]|nr:zinc ribbon domain-containing protein [Actinomycetota bacterium]